MTMAIHLDPGLILIISVHKRLLAVFCFKPRERLQIGFIPKVRTWVANRAVFRRFSENLVEQN